jgi:hypothetical protein
MAWGLEWPAIGATPRHEMMIAFSVASTFADAKLECLLTADSNWQFFDMALKKRQYLHKLFGVLSGRRSSSIVLLVTFVIVGFDCFQKTAYYSYKSTSRMER